jgi:hypothetical protein
MNQGLESYSIVSARGKETVERWLQSFPETSEAVRKVRESLNEMIMMGNRQEGMTPVEYKVRKWDLDIDNHVEYVDGIIVHNGNQAGTWSARVTEMALAAMTECDGGYVELIKGKEQPMSKCLFEVFMVHEGKYLNVWTGIASTPEGARFKALREFEIDTDIEDLDLFTRQVGVLRDDCCK